MVIELLLGGRVGESDRDRAWIARDRAGLAVGCAGLTTSWTGGRWFGPGLWIEVLPEHRGRGIGRLLAEPAIERARELGAAAVHAAHAIPEGPGAAAARRLGFADAIVAMEWTLDARRVRRECDRLLDRVRARRAGGLDDLSVKPLAEWTSAERSAVARLHAAELGGSVEELLRRMSDGSSDRFHPTVSRGLFDANGRALAVALTAVAPRSGGGCTGVVEGLVVAPERRRGAATPLLQRAVAQAYIEAGGRDFRLMTLDPHRDTRRHAARLGPSSTRELLRPFMALAAATDTARSAGISQR